MLLFQQVCEGVTVLHHLCVRFRHDFIPTCVHVSQVAGPVLLAFPEIVVIVPPLRVAVVVVLVSSALILLLSVLYGRQFLQLCVEP